MNKILDKLALQILIEAIGFSDIPQEEVEAAIKRMFGGEKAAERRRNALASISVTGGETPAIRAYRTITDAKKLKEIDKIGLIYKIICLYYIAFNNQAYKDYQKLEEENHYEQTELQNAIKSIEGLNGLNKIPNDYVQSYQNILESYIELRDEGNVLDFYKTGNNLFAELSRKNKQKFDLLNDDVLRPHESRMRTSKPPQTVRKDFIESIVTGPGAEDLGSSKKYQEAAKLFTAIEFLQARRDLEGKLTPRFTPAKKQTIKELGLLNRQKNYTTRLINMLYQKIKLFIKDFFGGDPKEFALQVKDQTALNTVIQGVKKEYYGPEIKEAVDTRRYFEERMPVLIDEFVNSIGALVPEMKQFMDANTNIVLAKISDYYSDGSSTPVARFDLDKNPEKLGKYPTAEGIMEQILKTIVIDSVYSGKIMMEFTGSYEDKKLIETLIQNEINILFPRRNVKNKNLVNETKKFKAITGLEWPFRELKE